jgi:hypothetical protein
MSIINEYEKWISTLLKVIKNGNNRDYAVPICDGLNNIEDYYDENLTLKSELKKQHIVNEQITSQINTLIYQIYNINGFKPENDSDNKIGKNKYEPFLNKISLIEKTNSVLKDISFQTEKNDYLVKLLKLNNNPTEFQSVQNKNLEKQEKINQKLKSNIFKTHLCKNRRKISLNDNINAELEIDLGQKKFNQSKSSLNIFSCVKPDFDDGIVFKQV